MTKLLVLSRTRPNIDLHALFKEHEFTITPLALFASDGTPHHTKDKSALLKAVEVLGPVTADEVDLDNQQVNAVVLDGMALVNKLRKIINTKTVGDLCQSFNSLLKHEIAGYEHVSLIFDQYNIGDDALNLKESTWQKRSKGVSVFYKVSLITDISKLTLKEQLSHPRTKNSLTGNRIA